MLRTTPQRSRCRSLTVWTIAIQTDINPGDVDDSFKADDGGWGHALECKAIPNLVPLVKPKITLSIDGLTLHLTDANGFDKVYPVGAGKLDLDDTSSTYRESFSFYPLIQSRPSGRLRDHALARSTRARRGGPTQETGEKSPVFAGLPFMSFDGAYAIHGPIDNYRAPNGGSLRRGYVSHGCFRMEAADVVEVYAYIKGIAHVPVHVQRAAEKRVDGTRVDLAAEVGRRTVLGRRGVQLYRWLLPREPAHAEGLLLCTLHFWLR